MEQSAIYNTTGEDIEVAASAAMAGQGVDINVDEELERVKAQPSGFNLPDDGFQPTDLSVLEQDVVSNVMPDSDVRLNESQRVALAGGNLDQAIALRGNNAGLGSFRGVA